MRRFHTCVCSTLHLPPDERRSIERLIARASVRDGYLAIDHPILVIEAHRYGYAVHVGAIEDHADCPASVPPVLWGLLVRALDEGATWLSLDREELPARGLPVFPDEDEPTVVAGSRSPVAVRCGTCGGANVMRDAWARWDDVAQNWVLGNVLDATFCDDCEADVTLVEQPLFQTDALKQAA